MTHKEIMERAQIVAPGKYRQLIQEFFSDFQDAMPPNTSYRSSKQTITANKRFYDIDDVHKLQGVFVKNHKNTEGEFRAIPRLLNEPSTPDEDNA
ncbi:MAG: hypothetical protein GOVbin4296_54 [Prokaryotic dsDNA virus sp.]|nr:MAG: hypothetical protein GOVbin4296_54 [Prokaryotic dsDNA virus sp.]